MDTAILSKVTGRIEDFNQMKLRGTMASLLGATPSKSVFVIFLAYVKSLLPLKFLKFVKYIDTIYMYLVIYY